MFNHQHVTLSVSSSSSSIENKTQQPHVPRLATPPDRLFLDVDNCLYREEQLHNKGIERQIVRGIKSFCQARCGLTEAQADGLYEVFGSTEEGLRRTLWKNATITQLRTFLKDYYDTVYSPVDVSGLLPVSGGTIGSSSSTTGYSHAQRAQRRTIRKLLSCSPTLVTISSNSPLFHVRKVLQAMGLCTAVVSKDILTPDFSSYGLATRQMPSSNKEGVFPTKASPTAFFGNLRQDDNTPLVMVDDSKANLKAVQRYMKGHLVSDKQSLVQALARTWGWLDESYEFSSVKYLQAKNVVDAQSIHRPTWNVLMTSLTQELSTRSPAQPLTIVDVGAGLLSMHHLLLHGEEEAQPEMPSLQSVLRSKDLTTHINYIAYEPNDELRLPCVEYLLEKGYALVQEYAWDAHNDASVNRHVQEMIFEKQIDERINVRVSLRFWDFRREIHTQGLLSPDLIVGCCFADLLDPADLTASILRNFLSQPTDNQASVLLYFPITFRGITQFVPSLPFVQDGNKVIPSDTQAFSVYSKTLEDGLGHSLNPDNLVESMRNHGGSLMAHGFSDWKIDATDHDYLWRTMMYFFATSAAPELQALGYDADEWIKRSWEKRPLIQASNCDLLFRLPYIGRWEPPDSANEHENKVEHDVLEIEFSAPNKVAFVPKQRSKLKPGEIRIKSLCSLISSGTELKIFTGAFDDAALDLNIKDMEGERMEYPLAYGYSLVGQVVECADDVAADAFLGKNVFTFSPHATEVVTSAGAVHLIPDGIDPLDAIFMPSVETALSIVHDAHPRLGEKIVVFGQGLIGLLATSLLSTMSLQSQNPCLTTVDTFPDRLALSSLFGSQQALLPSEVGLCFEFDVAIEASGNFRALQSAIDCIRNGGRVIVASWYGKEPASLKLGIDFHRSHKTLRTSQVSELPAELRETWTKQRRFDLTWELVGDIRPSRLLTKIAHPRDAQGAYEELHRGSQVSIAFDYTPTNWQQ